MIEYRHDLGTIRVMEPGDDLTEVLDLLGAPGPLSADTETTGLGVYLPGFRVRLVQLGTPDTAYVIPLDEHPGGRGMVREWFTRLAGTGRRAWLHNRCYDLLALERDCGVPFHESAPDSRPPPVSFSPPKAPPISAPEVPMLTLTIPQSEPLADMKRSASASSEVKIADESPCGTALFSAIASSNSS